MEALEENYCGGLDDRNVNLDSQSHRMYVHQIKNETCEMENQEDLEKVRFRVLLMTMKRLLLKWKKP